MSSEHRQPLDAEERELARVLRALPAGEPPSSIDAKILATARDAVVSTPNVADEARPPPRRAPRFAWGLGVAASCVLAAALVYRTGGFGAESLDGVGAPTSTEAAREAAPAMAPAMAPPPAAAVEAERQTLDRIAVPAARVDPELARPVSEDGRAGAQVWIQRIRARIIRGDADGARESLEAFIARHPDEALPQDLIDFRAGHASE